MAAQKTARTELEGAILSVISRRPGSTAYQVRKEFLDSPSAEWSGSAGSVYPAIKRLAAAGLVKRVAASRCEKLSLTKSGKQELSRWVENVQRAAGPGMDPFRTRAGHILSLSTSKRKALLLSLQSEIETQRKLINSLQSTSDDVEKAALELALALQTARLKWIKKADAR